MAKGSLEKIIKTLPARRALGRSEYTTQTVMGLYKEATA